MGIYPVHRLESSQHGTHQFIYNITQLIILTVHFCKHVHWYGFIPSLSILLT